MLADWPRCRSRPDRAGATALALHRNNLRMELWVSTLSAIAAVLAAILSGASLLVARRHARTQWVRDALVAALTDFLGASFDSKDAVKTAMRLARRDGPPGDEIDRLKVQADDACDKMRSTQARIRLLAPTELIEATQRLRVAELEYRAMLDGQPLPDLEVDKAARHQLRELRHRFVQAAKAELDLRLSRGDRSLNWGTVTRPPAD